MRCLAVVLSSTIIQLNIKLCIQCMEPPIGGCVLWLLCKEVVLSLEVANVQKVNIWDLQSVPCREVISIVSHVGFIQSFLYQRFYILYFNIMTMHDACISINHYCV